MYVCMYVCDFVNFVSEIRQVTKLILSCSLQKNNVKNIFECHLLQWKSYSLKAFLFLTFDRRRRTEIEQNSWRTKHNPAAHHPVTQ